MLPKLADVKLGFQTRPAPLDCLSRNLPHKPVVGRRWNAEAWENFRPPENPRSGKARYDKPFVSPVKSYSKEGSGAMRAKSDWPPREPDFTYTGKEPMPPGANRLMGIHKATRQAGDTPSYMYKGRLPALVQSPYHRDKQKAHMSGKRFGPQLTTRRAGKMDRMPQFGAYTFTDKPW